MKIKDRGNMIRNIFTAYIIYAFLFGIVIFGLYRPSLSKTFKKNSASRFWSEKPGQDRVVLVEERYDSGLARVNLIENTEKSLDITYYTIQDGVSTDIFLGTILEAADRGVQVRFLMDGRFTNMKGNLKDVIYSFENHPNIEFKFYEPFKLLKPWTFNNRLHDKFIVSDSEKVIIGGRNIGDRYFNPDKNARDIVNDRDVLILNTDLDNPSTSVLAETEEYFELIWNSEFTEDSISDLSDKQLEKGREKYEYLMANLDEKKATMPEVFGQSIDWLEESLATNKITLVHNPIERFKKEPWTWYELLNLAEAAEESIFIQSPYVIPTRSMRSYLDLDNIKAKESYILTNSLGSSPNLLGISGYKKYRKDIVDSGTTVYEYQGPGSIHGKSYIYDDRIAAIGSFNLDERSTHLSTETMMVIDSVEFVERLKDEIEKQVSSSLEVASDYSYIDNPLVEEIQVPFLKSLMVKILTLVNYFFDFML